MPKKNTKEEIIEKAIKIHGNKYDYSNVNYINTMTKIEIICKINKHGSFFQMPNNHISKKQGCPKCSGRLILHEEFIEKSKKIHNHKYDYSKSIYTKAINKIIIICKIHGEFKQTAFSHLQGQGCSKCYGGVAFTIKNFIENANKIHNHLYDYSNVIYINSNTKVDIICKIHGIFKQSPMCHINMKHGCTKCFSNEPLNLISFIQKANKKHNYLYDYSLSKYVDSSTKIDILCKLHGVFSVSPRYHLRGIKCYKCSGKRTTKEFIEKSNKIHNNLYNYDKVNYIDTITKVIITCKSHGDFLQVPTNHFGGQGCPKCVHTISRGEISWLNSLNIPLEYRNKHVKINEKLFKPDAIDKANKIIWEFYGDFWHGNPLKFNQEKINYINKKTFKALYEKTLNKEKFLKENGYTVISIWENDWNQLESNKTINH